MFSSEDEKRPTQLASTKPCHCMCESVGEAGCAWPSRDAWGAKRARLHETKESETLEKSP